MAYASLMEVGVAASSQTAKRVPKGAPCIARHTVVGNVVFLRVAQKVPKGARRCAKDMGEEGVASLTAVGSARRAYTEAQTFVLLMVVERGVSLLGAPRVHGDELIAV